MSSKQPTNRPLLAIQKRIDSVQHQQKVVLIAVSKSKSVHQLQMIINQGQRHFAENYLQEALVKIEALQGQNLIWHFIGPIQSNKTGKIAQNFDWVHSVERIKIAKRLNQQRPQNMGKLNILLQINIDNEPSKSGILIEQIEEIVDSIKLLKNLILRGFMCIAKVDNADNNFKKMAQIFAKFPDFDTLSMGMSADLESAVKNGATFVRIGTNIFGKRSDNGN